MHTKLDFLLRIKESALKSEANSLIPLQRRIRTDCLLNGKFKIRFRARSPTVPKIFLQKFSSRGRQGSSSTVKNRKRAVWPQEKNTPTGIVSNLNAL